MKIHHLKQTTSTQDELKALARQGAEVGTVVVAERQTQGRGRQGRDWFGDEHSLLFSILYRPLEPLADVSAWVKMVSHAVVSGVKKVVDVPIRLEWPNDLIIDNEKVGGILIEAASQGDDLQFVVVGIGLNVNNLIFPEVLEPVATSLCLKKGEPVDKAQLLNVLVDELRHLES